MNRDANSQHQQRADVGEDGGSNGDGDGLVGGRSQPLNDGIGQQGMGR